VYYVTLMRHNTLWTVLKHTYFMAVIDSVFCLIYKCKMLSVTTLERCEIMRTYNSPDAVVKDRRTRSAIK